MKEKFLKRKWLRVLAAVCMSVMLLLSMVQGAFAAEDSGRTTGSLSLTLAVTEDGEQVPLTGVPLALYQVADMDTEPVVYFHLASSLAGAGVDLNNLKTAADAENASKVLANKVGGVGIVPLTGVTDGEGKLFFGSLPRIFRIKISPSSIWSRSVNSLALGSPLCPESTQWVLLPPTGRELPSRCPIAICRATSSVP